jgi:Tol biopolymer transport system component
MGTRGRLILAVVVASMALVVPAVAQGAWPGVNGPIVYALSPPVEVRAVDADGVSNDRSLFAPLQGSGSTLPRWSADGRRIVYREAGNGTDPAAIVVRDPDGSDPQFVFSSESIFSGPSLSPDGERVVFFGRLDGQVSPFGDVYVVDVDGSDLRRITVGANVRNAPVWSPDGSTIAFQGRVDIAGTFRIFTVDVSNLAAPGPPVQRTPDATNASVPDWAPDSSRIYYLDGTASALASIKPDGSDPQSVAIPGLEQFSLSPDGTKVAYDVGASAFIANIDGTNAVPVNDFPPFGFNWGPVAAPIPAPVCPAVPPKGLVSGVVYGLGKALNLPPLMRLACGLGI